MELFTAGLQDKESSTSWTKKKTVKKKNLDPIIHTVIVQWRREKNIDNMEPIAGRNATTVEERLPLWVKD